MEFSSMLDRISSPQQESPFNEVMPQRIAEEFEKRAVLLKRASKQSILTQTDQTNDVFLIRKGLVEFSLLAASSKETLFRECGPGELFGELAALDDSLRSVNATVVRNAELYRMKANQFQNLLQESEEFRHWFDRLLAHRIRELSQRVFALSTMTVPCRIWNDLINRADHAGRVDGPIILADFPTHKKLASFLGTHREAVSRELRELAKEGIVSQKGRILRILDLERLNAMLRRHLG